MNKERVYLFETELNYPGFSFPSVSFIREFSIPESEKPIINEEEVIEIVKTGGNAILASDLSLSLPITVNEDVKVKVNLNGHNIIAGTFKESNGEALEGSTDSYAVWAKNGTTILEGNGEVKAAEAKYSMAVWANGGDVIINGGTYTNGGDGCDLIYASGNSTITINDGTFIATSKKGTEPGTKNEYSALNIKDKDRETAKIIVKGGKFFKFDPANNVSEGPGTNFVADGYESVAEGDYFIVRKKIS